MKRFWLVLSVVLATLLIGYAVGPRVSLPLNVPQTTLVTTDLTKLDAQVAAYEARFPIKPDNEARVVWHNKQKQQTPYSIVYLHGFGASQAEGDPVHRDLARQFGCNLYLARTDGHGLSAPDVMKTMTPASYLASAERALAIGKVLGKKVIVMGTSMGGMLTLYLASKHPEIEGLILYSPCVGVANPALRLVTKPWGRQILSTIFPDDYVHAEGQSAERAPYWYRRYHTNGLLTLQTILDEYATPETFAKIRQPTFMAYYYRDEEHQDKTVSVAALLNMFDELGTPTALKQKQDFPNADAHVIASHLTTKAWPEVEKATAQFMQKTLKINTL